MKYYKMDNVLYCAIGLQHMYMHMQGQEPKLGLIKDNLYQIDIIELQPQITKAEFEASLPSNTPLECMYKGAYLVAAQQQLIMSN